MTCLRISRPVCWAASCYCRLRQADWRWAPGKVFTWANIETLVGLVTSWPPFRVSTYNRWRQRLLNFSGCLSNSGQLGYN
ncbi:Lysine/ornithine N-monooxygenase [Pseudomonas syringae pv. actinidiae]|uniref:Lysine/ornithine N-monooxygenase n=1 Tax=Pseudomonas syringae pv. actinidiae TaxID=103796 RepID=A0A2V0QC33_PSESF|nr:Lysine/ornithine N-monooxygenase [Pseudomonas syringae pv. actinidiae]